MSSLITPNPTTHDPRVQRLLARLRRKQLDLAMAGQIADSARYAKRAWRVRLFGRRAGELRPRGSI